MHVSDELQFLYQVKNQDDTQVMKEDMQFLSNVQQVIANSKIILLLWRKYLNLHFTKFRDKQNLFGFQTRTKYKSYIYVCKIDKRYMFDEAKLFVYA